MSQNIKLLLSEINLIRKHYDEIATLTGENFNVFKILKLTTNELRHSAFIAELLNPNGNHGQKDVFLKLFLEQINIPDFSFNTESANAISEYDIGTINKDKTEGGRIDILIIDKHYKKSIIIENKIYAPDQNNQIERYYNYAIKKFSNFLIIYLTLDDNRKPPKDATDKPEILKRLKCVTYQEKIINWLENCQKEAVNLPIIRESIQQYIHLLKNLTGKSINKIMGNDIIKDIIKNAENYDAFLSIQEINGDKVREVLLDKLTQQIEAYANKNNMTLREKPTIKGILEMDEYINLLIRESKQNTSIVIGWDNEDGDQFYYGINTEAKDEAVINEIKTKWDKTFGQSCSTTDVVLCSNNFDYFQTWRRDKETWKSIVNDEMFDKIIQPKLEKMYESIKSIEGI